MRSEVNIIKNFLNKINSDKKSIFISIIWT